MPEKVVVHRPVPKAGLLISIVAGGLTGAGLLMGAMNNRGPARWALALFGGAMLVGVLALVFSGSGVVIDRGARTITPWFRVFIFRWARPPVTVSHGDRLRVDVLAVHVGGDVPHRSRAARVMLVGPAGERFLLATKTGEQAQDAAGQIARPLALPIDVAG